MLHLFFSHGKYSHPNSTKIAFLNKIAQEFGITTKSMDYTHTTNPEERVELLRKEIALVEEQPLILVGSSMGGYVSTVLASEKAVEGLFLMAPAFYLEGYAQQQFQPQTAHIEIVHGWKDATVPFEQSVLFGEKHAAQLHLVEDNHRLSGSHELLKELFRAFLRRIV